MKTKTIELKKRKYPLCPECGQATIVGFTPPKEGMYCDGDPEKVDWNKAHMYCCNVESNCEFDTRFLDLTTPLSEPKETEAK